MGEEEASTVGHSAGSTRSTNDEALVAGLRRGDEDAFRTLVDEHGPFLMRLALMHVPSRAIAEEVVQDTWLAVLNGIDRFEGRSSLRTWIAGILLNIARTRGRRERRVLPFSVLWRDAGRRAVTSPRWIPTASSRSAIRGPASGHARPPSGPRPRSASAPRKHAESCWRRSPSSPSRQREVIALRDISGWSAAEARNALGLSETNQRVLLHRARSKVRAALESYFEEENRVE